MSDTFDPKTMYPMNQDKVATEILVYGSAIQAIASRVIKAQEVTGCDLDTALAQVDKDLRSMVDQTFKPS